MRRNLPNRRGTPVDSKLPLPHPMHTGLAHFVDEPEELYHSHSWASSIRSTSGEFAHIIGWEETEDGVSSTVSSTSSFHQTLSCTVVRLQIVPVKQLMWNSLAFLISAESTVLAGIIVMTFAQRRRVRLPYRSRKYSVPFVAVKRACNHSIHLSLPICPIPPKMRTIWSLIHASCMCQKHTWSRWLQAIFIAIIIGERPSKILALPSKRIRAVEKANPKSRRRFRNTATVLSYLRSQVTFTGLSCKMGN